MLSTTLHRILVSVHNSSVYPCRGRSTWRIWNLANKTAEDSEKKEDETQKWKVPLIQDKEEAKKRAKNFIHDGISTHNMFQSLQGKSSTSTNRGYSPPKNVRERLETLVKEVYGDSSDWTEKPLTDPLLKFKVLTKCEEEFGHTISNTSLHDMNTGADVLDFFLTPVRDTTAYEDLAKLDLPRNLHIQLEPKRFHPETDTKFGGISAFPGRDTIVTSIKYRKKYKGYKWKPKQPYFYTP
ncbi:uncharacterized protein LOC106161586 [Lingula anatina]|uniref:Large ribosomal subunit protein mL50 n=1 Tax=Lingula anatina TaxID=7574 RepID=A0A1S3I852_LINAN|nr:uncharacterized protein LOC106161586 [Lingula anatina]|eukprot:XP_013394041.1 uncharacterized protein LOC106161586 [Lingula anatina]